MDIKNQVTVVAVHTPLIQFSASGGYYTSYAISLKSNNPCFTKSYSQIRRRYSEFLHLRQLLANHHPTIKPPALPPKNYFYRFSDAFIEERKNGLQTFLEKVLATPVYLSDKSLHLFLQSSCSMSQIDEQCLGDIPVPQLLDNKPINIPYLSDSSSSASVESMDRKTSNRISENCRVSNLKSSGEESSHSENGRPSTHIHKLNTVPSSHNFKSSKPCMIPRRQGSLDSSPASSVSSLDNSYCSSSDLNRSRHVSFNENVTVAVVCNQLWNIGVKPMRTHT